MNKAENVKKWRNNTKKRIIQAFNNKCGVCGYDKCDEALDLHHLEPTQKEFSFGAVRANIISWERMVVELRKCVMLCANCHREFHANKIKIPKNITRFNEEFNDYKSKKFKDVFDNCPVCNKQKDKHNKTCSKTCAAKLAGKVKWNEVDLKDLLLNKRMSYVKIGDSLNVSEAAVRKRAKKLGLESTFIKK